MPYGDTDDGQMGMSGHHSGQVSGFPRHGDEDLTALILTASDQPECPLR
jgi:hypothetical protein